MSLMNRRSVAVLTASHLCTDLGPGALPAFLPFLIAEHHFTYAVAAGLVLASSLFSSFLQPVFGQFSDRRPAPWLAPIGLLLAGVGLAAIGIAPTYTGILAAAALSGIGVAAFHPEAARLVSQASGEQRGSAMSFFAVGGNAGFAVGPVVATALLSWTGVKGAVFLVIPAGIMALVLAQQLTGIVTDPRAKVQATTAPLGRDAWGPFGCLTATVICRSIIFFGFNTFLPLYWINELHQTPAAGATALTVLLMMGAVGTLLGGQLADRWGRQTVVVAGFGLLPLLLILFLAVQNAGLSLVMLVPIGLALFAPYSVMVVLGQDFLPNRIGIASGVTLGLAGSIGGLTAPLLGSVADHWGIRIALAVLVGISILALGLSILLLRQAEPQLRDIPAAQ